MTKLLPNDSKLTHTYLFTYDQVSDRDMSSMEPVEAELCGSMLTATHDDINQYTEVISNYASRSSLTPVSCQGYSSCSCCWTSWCSSSSWRPGNQIRGGISKGNV